MRGVGGGVWGFDRSVVFLSFGDFSGCFTVFFFPERFVCDGISGLQAACLLMVSKLSVCIVGAYRDKRGGLYFSEIVYISAANRNMFDVVSWIF